MLKPTNFSVAHGHEYFGFNNEYTKLVHSLKKEQESNRRLRETNYSLERFLTIIAHDLRAPYNTMLGYSTILIENFESFNRNKIKECLVNLQKSAKTNYQLTQNLLAWSMIQRGDIKLDKQKLNLKNLIDQVINTYENMAEQKGIRLIGNCPDTLAGTLDKNVAISVLSNLVVNALKYTHKGGIVEIKVKKINQDVLFKVTDTGIGMFPSVARNLFKLNRITSTAGTKNESGTGLGLILCKELMHIHRGEIQVKSEVGKGTTVLAYFNHIS